MNITYLLGAGASFNALPIVEQIPEELGAFAERFNPGTLSDINNGIRSGTLCADYLEKLKPNFEEIKKTHQDMVQFYDDILWLEKEASNHTSIDTFAKKLYLQQDQQKLKTLKVILSCFFSYLQTKRFDKRYDSFFASILDDLSVLPHQLKIASWNYDSQLESAFSKFANITSLDFAKRRLNMHARGDVDFESYEPNQFCVYKVNGSTNIIDDKSQTNNIIDSFNDNNNDDESIFIESFLEAHKSIKNNKNRPVMTFAWEGKFQTEQYLNNLSHSLSETEILIVIGYSFPFFNRKIDSQILNSFDKLKTVYVQDPKNADAIIQKIKSLIQGHIYQEDHGPDFMVKFEPITYTDQFFIPIEF